MDTLNDERTQNGQEECLSLPELRHITKKLLVDLSSNNNNTGQRWFTHRYI